MAFYQKFKDAMDNCATEDILTETSELHVEFLVPELGFQYVNPLSWWQANENNNSPSIIL
jgi:hypothetical protein